MVQITYLARLLKAVANRFRKDNLEFAYLLIASAHAVKPKSPKIKAIMDADAAKLGHESSLIDAAPTENKALAELLKKSALLLPEADNILSFELIACACELDPTSEELAQVKNRQLVALVNVAKQRGDRELINEVVALCDIDIDLDANFPTGANGIQEGFINPRLMKSQANASIIYKNNQRLIREMVSSVRSEEEIKADWDDSSVVISVVCTSFNQESTIEDAICSFLMQKTSVPFEIIMQDDCSTDRTRDVIDEYARRYPSIVKPSYPNTNLYSKGYSPLKAGLLSSSGDFIAYCEGDDYFNHPAKLQIQYEAIVSDPNVFSCFHKCIVMNEVPMECRDYFKRVRLPRKTTRFNQSDLLNRDTPLLRVNALMHRRPSSIEAQFPDELTYIVNGDVFNSSVMGLFGSAILLEDFKASTYRKTGSGVWTGIDHHLREVYKFSTIAWLGLYYHRIEHSAAETFLTRAQRLGAKLAFEKRHADNPFYARALEACQKVNELKR